MYKLSIPISLDSLTEETVDEYLDYLKKCKADRVFIVGWGNIYSNDSAYYTKREWAEKAMKIFKDNGYEVGVWFCAFGHGEALSTADAMELDNCYTSIEGIDGKVSGWGFCPSDKNFFNDYSDAVKKIAELGPDIIMLDDDFRINTRPQYYLGCFCPYHLKEYSKRIGEDLPRKKIEELILTGGKNKYRDAGYKVMGDSLRRFCQRVRQAVDEVNPNIRVGICAGYTSWDIEGADVIELAKILAGNTKPFYRLTSAPYWVAPKVNRFPGQRLSAVIENARNQIVWSKDENIEFFA